MQTKQIPIRKTRSLIWRYALGLTTVFVIGLSYFAGKNELEPEKVPVVQPTPSSATSVFNAEHVQITAIDLDTTKWVTFETTFPSNGYTLRFQHPTELTLVDSSRGNETIWFYADGVSGTSPIIAIATIMLKGAINEKMEANTASRFTIGNVLINQFEYSHGIKWVFIDPETDQRLLSAHIALLAGEFTEEEITVGKEMMTNIVKTIQIERSSAPTEVK